jgi:hypothetical protein
MGQVEIFFHAGMGKTGTSALQAFLAENSEILRTFGVLYPSAHRSMADGGAHHALALSMMKNRPAWAPVISGASPEQILMDMYREARSLGLSRIVVSSEILYVIPPHAVRDLGKRFRSRIILYVRRQDTHAMSLLNQAIKATGKYCDDRSVSCPLMPRGRYLRKVVEWMEAFPKADLVFRPYERQQFVSGDLIADFLSVLGVPKSPDFRETQEKVNQSLDRDALEYMNLLNAVVSDLTFTRTIGALLVACAREERGGESQDWPLLSPAERLAMIERYADLNATIARTYLGRKDGRLFHDPLPNASDEWRPYPGLSRERAETITASLRQKNATLVDELRSRLRTPVQHFGMAARQAMQVLIPAVEEVCRRTAA